MWLQVAVPEASLILLDGVGISLNSCTSDIFVNVCPGGTNKANQEDDAGA
jgi:hypothetical protein